MSKTELPHSVRFPKDLGAGTVTIASDGHKITEEKGLALKRRGVAYSRIIHVEPQDRDPFSATFQHDPKEDISTIGIYQEHKPRRHAARNGSYVEIGKLGARAQYALDGALIMQDIDPKSALPALFPLAMQQKDIQFIGQLCDQLRNPSTPKPEGLVKMAALLDSILEPHEVIQEPPLFPHQLGLL